jgi:hypothetical protein
MTYDITIYTDLPKDWHKQTLYDWGSRGLRTYGGKMFRGTNGRNRCYLDKNWLRDFEVIPARQGHYYLLRRISRVTTEWLAVARRRGAYWPISYYLVPKKLAQAVREQIAHEQANSGVPF